MNFKQIAKKATTIAEIMMDRDKISTEEIIDEFDGDITITEIEWCDMGENSAWAYAFEEDKDKFAFAGKVLGNVFNACLAACGGDYEELYKKWEPLHVRISSGRTKKNQQVTLVEVLD